MKRFDFLTSAAGWAAAGLLLAAEPVVQRTPETVAGRKDDRTTLLYHLTKPADSRLSVDSAAYFHPFATPAGVTVTDVAPDDHRHHRGIFLAWVELHGNKGADFWGWGEHAPKQNRRVINRAAEPLPPAPAGAGFRVLNDWQADTEVMLAEQVDARVRDEGSARILDLTYTLTAKSDVRLARWAFSGFCARVRKDGELKPFGPAGPVHLLAPRHDDPTWNWPAAPWYAVELGLKDAAPVSVAVVNHPANPPTTWHNALGIGMLNPCIVAPGEVWLRAGVPLVLKYRVVAADGPVPAALLNRLAEAW
jgi:hypothetical protein